MKKLTLINILFILTQVSLISQSCLPDGIEFSTQEHIDNFSTDYPNCNIIEGDVTISGEYITNLNGLSVLTSIGGYFAIGYDMNGNPSLNDLTGLENLKNVNGGLIIEENNQLTNLFGLSHLSSVNVGLWVKDNNLLTSLEGIDSLINIQGEIQIHYNPSLTSLSGLSKVIPGNIDEIQIRDNYTLTSCEVNATCTLLSDSIASALIINNSLGCNNITEVLNACESLGIQISNSNNSFSFFPNPTSDFINFTYENNTEIIELNIYNNLGQKVLHKTKIKDNINIKTLDQGLYIIELVINNTPIRDKLIIK